MKITDILKKVNILAEGRTANEQAAVINAQPPEIKSAALRDMKLHAKEHFDNRKNKMESMYARIDKKLPDDATPSLMHRHLSRYDGIRVLGMQPDEFKRRVPKSKRYWGMALRAEAEWMLGWGGDVYSSRARAGDVVKYWDAVIEAGEAVGEIEIWYAERRLGVAKAFVQGEDQPLEILFEFED